VTLGGGTQERLGLYLRSELDCKPSIHCIGAAIAFLSGDQVQIPRWADRMYLGWLFRCLSDPRRYMPRYWDARKLFSLMVRYGSSLPEVLKSNSPAMVELTAVSSQNDCIPSTPSTSR
jgi:UDP-N-acetyl-D-mannosaminuronic acid transferase (WecB/TagA/CpsF family)